MVNKIKGYRTMAGYTQEEMAALLSLSRSSYVHKELGSRPLSIFEKKEIFKNLKKRLPTLSFEDVFPIE